ncbi:hypothetical protein M9Y10_034124 [Tritrichomonas musculus]|uniref:Protein kinase domain-containing protein n=1 Tax=Tritrichomonas musculus TaxID=1915356 RepID=A0ABR2KEP9_9EUKA
MNKSLKLFKQDDLSRYKILKHISARSRCDFFKVVEKETDQLYTYKILRPANDNDQEDDCDQEDNLFSNKIKKFIEEAEIWSIINSPLIVKMIGLCFNYKIQNNSTAIMVLEYCLNGSLEKLIGRIKSGQKIQEWNDTRKLICIYGIAAGMQYLHSKQIIHLDLRPANILLNESLSPKINDFYTSIKIGKNNESSLQKNAETVDYMAPEIVIDDHYSTAADVYSFGVTIHEILICEKPYEDSENNRNVKISDQIPKSYQNLISKCLATDPSHRPTFSDIVKYLRNNKKIITESVNEEEFLQFCEFVDSKHKAKSEPEKRVDIDLKPIDLSLFKREELIKKEQFANVYRVVELKTGSNFAAKVNNDQDNQSPSREINVLIKLSSNTILKFIGYNEKDFNNKPRMTIITEFAKNGSLDKILDNERKKVPDPKWNDTKRLINIFGIAFGMSYLHAKNILHRDLKPENIFLNDLFFPKIGGFRFSKEIEYISEEGDVAGTPAYMSPELIMKAVNHKASDVYSFAFVVYEMVTLEVPFEGLDKSDILMKVTSGYRPEIAENVPDCYRELIQKCWSQDPSERPTFDSIVDLLKSNTDFITNTVDRGEYIRYVNFLIKCSSDSEGVNEKEILSDLLKIEEEEEEAEIEKVHISVQCNNSSKNTEEDQTEVSICEEESENEEEQRQEEHKFILKNIEEQKVTPKNVISENEEDQTEYSLGEEDEEEENEEDQSEYSEKNGVVVKLDCSEEADESEQRSEFDESYSEADKRNRERTKSGQAQKSAKSKNNRKVRQRRARQTQNKQVVKIKVDPDQPENPNKKENIEKEKTQKEQPKPAAEKEDAKPTQANTNAQVPKEPSTPPKNVKKSPPLKPFISHYDRSVFYEKPKHNSPPLMQAKPVYGNSPGPIKLTVTLKDIGLEGLDSPIPSKAVELREKVKIEQENAKLSARNQQNSQVPLSPSRRAHLAPINESNINSPSQLNTYNSPKPVSLLSSAQKAKRSQTIIPKTSSRKNKY